MYLNGSGVSQVTELFGENGENGKKVYEYNNAPDIVASYFEKFTGALFPMRPPANSTTQFNSNGQLIHETDYGNISGQFIKLKETVNQYSVPVINRSNIYGIENRQMSGGSFGDGCGTAITTGAYINNYSSFPFS